MVEDDVRERVDNASRIILAAPRLLFRTFLDPEMLQAWRVPDGARGALAMLDPRIGGCYRLVLDHPGDGDTAVPAREIVEGRFIDMLPDERVVEEVRHLVDDREWRPWMTLTTLIEPVTGGTKVTLRATGVPDTLDAKAHRAALAAMLWRLAMLTE